MTVSFEKVLDGASKYINTYMYSGMNDWQELLARVAVARLFANQETLKNSLINNPVVRTFAIIDNDGMVDIDTLAADVRTAIKDKGKIEVSLPVFGKWTFMPTDVDELVRIVRGEQEVLHETY